MGCWTAQKLQELGEDQDVRARPRTLNQMKRTDEKISTIINWKSFFNRML